LFVELNDTLDALDETKYNDLKKAKKGEKLKPQKETLSKILNYVKNK